MTFAFSGEEHPMSQTISSLPPATAPIPHESNPDGVPDTDEIAFSELWQDKESGFGFADILDIINPLQHIPIISTAYRMITGDEISTGARIAGGTLYGGPLGMIGAGVVAAVEEATDGTIEEHVASIFSDKPSQNEQTATQNQHPAAEKLEDNNRSSMAESGEVISAVPAAGKNRNQQEASISRIPPENILFNRSNAFAAADSSDRKSVATNLSKLDEQKLQQFIADRRKATGIAATNDAAEKKRISDEVLRAQQAQAGLLLANLASAPDKNVENDKSSDVRQPGDLKPPAATPFFKPHPYMLPRGAPPSLVAKAMEHALERYNSLNARRDASISESQAVTSR